MRIGKNRTFTLNIYGAGPVPNTQRLEVYKDGKILGDTGAKFVLYRYNYILMRGARDNPEQTNNNFYNNEGDGGKIMDMFEGVYDRRTDTTPLEFTWNLNAGGSGVAGWKLGIATSYSGSLSGYGLASNKPSGLSATVKQNLITGRIDIALTGTIPASYIYNTSDPSSGTNFDKTLWLGGAEVKSPAAGKYAGVSLTGVFDNNLNQSGKPVGINETNEALKFFAGQPNLAAVPPDGPVANNPISLQGSRSFRWQLYSADTFSTTDTLDFLIWSGAAKKTAELMITVYHNEYPATLGEGRRWIYVDYNGVTFN
jgi:hypothetical protein